MSSGDHDHAVGEQDAAAHQAFLKKLLDNPRVVRAIQHYTKENDSYDIPFLGGSNNAGDTVYFDKSFVAAIKAGKVKYDGKAYDPRRFLKVHESVEGACIRVLGCNYDTDNKAGLPGGHLIATWAEHRAVADSGLDWNKYQASLKGWIVKDEAEQAKNPPPDLLKVPYVGTKQAVEVAKPQHPEIVMVDLTADKRKAMPSSSFALSGKRFPLNDATHQRLAIGGATRAQHAGNISASTAERIKAEARRKLGISPGGYVPNPMGQAPGMAPGIAPQLPQQVPQNPIAQQRHHALSIASATHLHNAGHLPRMQAETIKAKARANINQLKRQPPAPPMAFGSLAPMLPGGQGA